MSFTSNGQSNGTNGPYSILSGVKEAIEALKKAAGSQLPLEIKEHLGDVIFNKTVGSDGLYFPCPFKETEAGAALRAVEASAAAAIADIRYGKQTRKLVIDLEKTAAFMFSTYIATIGGLGKADPKVKTLLKGMVNSQLHCTTFRL